MQLQVGEILEGKVTGITNFGAFVLLPDGTTGLVHISEISEGYVKDINDYLKENQVVKVKILSLDRNGKVSLSIKKAKEMKLQNEANPGSEEEKANNNGTTFEERLAKFLKDSDERLLDLKKNVEAKRGSGAFKRMAHF